MGFHILIGFVYQIYSFTMSRMRFVFATHYSGTGSAHAIHIGNSPTIWLCSLCSRNMLAGYIGIAVNPCIVKSTVS